MRPRSSTIHPGTVFRSRTSRNPKNQKNPAGSLSTATPNWKVGKIEFMGSNGKHPLANILEISFPVSLWLWIYPTHYMYPTIPLISTIIDIHWIIDIYCPYDILFFGNASDFHGISYIFFGVRHCIPGQSHRALASAQSQWRLWKAVREPQDHGVVGDVEGWLKPNKLTGAFHGIWWG